MDWVREVAVAEAEEPTEVVLVILSDLADLLVTLETGVLVDRHRIAVEHPRGAEVVDADAEQILRGLTGVLHRGRLRPHVDEVLLLVGRDLVEPARADALRAVRRRARVGRTLGSHGLRVRAKRPVLRAVVPRVRRAHEVVSERERVPHLVRDDGVVRSTSEPVLHPVRTFELHARSVARIEAPELVLELLGQRGIAERRERLVVHDARSALGERALETVLERARELRVQALERRRRLEHRALRIGALGARGTQTPAELPEGRLGELLHRRRHERSLSRCTAELVHPRLVDRRPRRRCVERRLRLRDPLEVREQRPLERRALGFRDAALHRTSLLVLRLQLLQLLDGHTGDRRNALVDLGAADDGGDPEPVRAPRSLDPLVDVRAVGDLLRGELTADVTERVDEAAREHVVHVRPDVDARRDVLAGQRIVGVRHDPPRRVRLRGSHGRHQVEPEVTETRDRARLAADCGVESVDRAVAENDHLRHLRDRADGR